MYKWIEISRQICKHRSGKQHKQGAAESKHEKTKARLKKQNKTEITTTWNNGLVTTGTKDTAPREKGKHAG